MWWLSGKESAQRSVLPLPGVSNATLIDTLELGSDEQKQKYEIYGDDAQTPTFAVIYRQQGDSWQQLDEKITFAAHPSFGRQVA